MADKTMIRAVSKHDPVEVEDKNVLPVLIKLSPAIGKFGHGNRLAGGPAKCFCPFHPFHGFFCGGHLALLNKIVVKTINLRGSKCKRNI